jgi:hypothetical protein
MGNQTPRNYRSAKYTGLTTTYVEITDVSQSYLSVFVQAEGLFLSLGHETPTDGTSVIVPPNTSFDLPTGVLGPVFVRSATGTSTTAHVVAA